MAKKNDVVKAEKASIVQSMKDKASGLVNYNEKDLEKLDKERNEKYDDWYVTDLAYRLLKDPQNEEILKEVSGLSEKPAKALKSILNRKKIRLAVIAGSVVVIGAAATAIAVKGKKTKSSKVSDEDSEEEEFDDDVVEVDYDEVDEDDESDEEVDEAPVEE